MTRSFRPPELERARRRDSFDPVAAGAGYHLSPKQSLDLWQVVTEAVEQNAGRLDVAEARQRFLAVAARMAARGGQLRPAPGRLTRVGVELGDDSLDQWRFDELTSRTPGRTTLVLAEEQRARQRDKAAGIAHENAAVPPQPQERAELPGASDVAQAMAALQSGTATPETAEVPPTDVPRLDEPAAVPLSNETEPPVIGWTGRSSSREGRPLAELFARQLRAGVTQQPEPSGPVRLPASLKERMERAFGRRFDDVEVHPSSPEVPAGQSALTRDRHIHLEPGAVDLASPRGEQIIAHELAHVAQQSGTGAAGERVGTRKQLEIEAQRAAAVAVQGGMARVALRAQPMAAYAFSEGDVEPAGDQADEAHEAHDAHDAHDDAAHPDTHTDAHELEAKPHDVDPHTGAEAKHEEAADHGDNAEDSHAGDASLSGDDLVLGTVPAEDGAPGAPSGGGGPAAKPQKQAPNVAAAKPEVGLGQLQGVRPDKLGPVLGQVHTAEGADISKTRAAQQANPPKQMSSGASVIAPGTAPGAKPKDAGGPGAKPNEAAAQGGTGAAGGAKKADPDHPVKAEVPGGEIAKQAQQGQAAQQQKSAGEVVAKVAQSIASWFSGWGSAFGGHGAGEEGNAPKMTDADAKKMAGSVDSLSTKSSDVSTDAGPPPSLEMKGEAKADADKNRADLETKTTALETQGRADSRVTLGEDHIETTTAPEELTAMSLATGGTAGPAAALPSLAGAASSEEAGIVAQEQHGAEVDAALAKASTDVTAERSKHTEEEAKARAESDAQVHELKGKADADQAAARAAAQTEVQAARGQWQAEIDTKGADARKQGDKKVAEGMSQVEAEETKANTEAKKHIDEGKQKADQEKQKGEKEAADAKEKGKEKSSGVFGWLASKAKAAFDGIKKAVSAAIDACRRAVKAVIDAAKKLAMAAIELARKAITAAIKAVGQALIAISNVLHDEYTDLKAKFQNAIRKTVDKAVNAVNKLADGLKKAVQKALDMLGAALDKALQLLEKGINAIIDAANAVVQGAIKAAQAIVEALGTWAKLIKDVVAGPGSWLSKLGAAIIDGIKNHLWSAFKTAVVEWFKSKVFELLGVGGMILQLLLEGGLTKDHIVQMAMDALMVAIPAALVMILVEKLVAMIVPAAGALMAVIEGLQAAWGTISRIIAAFAAFMAFLLAVKSGGAGPLFATVLASAAVVVLDFVANWLLKKLAGAAKKVGAKLKRIAEKFKNKRKAKKDASAAKKHHDEHDAKSSRTGHQGHDDKGPRKHDDREAKPSKDRNEKQQADKRAEAQKRLDAARSALKVYLKRPRGQLALKAKLFQLKLRYRLKELSLQVSGNRAQIHGSINPEFIEYADAEVIVSNDELTEQAQSEGLVSFFRSMSLAELKKIVATGRLTTKSNKGKPSSEMMLAEQNYFATHPEREQGKDLGKGYSVDLIERKQNTRGSKGYDYAVLVKIEVLRSAKNDVLLNPQNARLDPSTTTPNRDVLQNQGVDLEAVTRPISPGERGVVMLKVESNRGTAVAVGGKFEPTKVMNYSIRPVDPEGVLEGDPLTELNKRIYRITLIGGGIGRREIVFL